MISDEVIQARDDAWTEWSDWEYTEYLPRFYKHRVKSKLAWINPWTSMEERNKAEEHRQALYQKWLSLNAQVVLNGGPRMSPELVNLWKREMTLDGERWRRTK